MIKIWFPPGCYGHYLARCLYNFTELRSEPYNEILFEADGSSHSFRTNTLERKQIRVGHGEYITKGRIHPATLTILPDDQVVTILPVVGHWLDYHNNQYVKQTKSSISVYFADCMNVEELNQKLKDFWGYTDPISEAMPKWILRELISFFIEDTLFDGYNQDRCNVETSGSISTDNLFDNFVLHFKKLCHDLNINITVNDDIINTTSNTFTKYQTYHQSQIRCDHWVLSVINNIPNVNNPSLTIFDEAYIQSRLRKYGYEIKCDGLNILPVNSTQMSNIIYKV
jgi:hypothetical protein